MGRRDVLRPVADEDLAAQLLQPLRGVRFLHVRTGDLVAQIQEHLGDAAHTDAADADKMDVFNLFEHRMYRASRSPGPRPTPWAPRSFRLCRRAFLSPPSAQPASAP